MFNKLTQLFKKKESFVATYVTMLVFGILGFLAAFTLSVEKLELLQNPDAKLSCSVNLVLNCASVMKTPQASVFGFPNSYLGIMGFAIVICVAMGGLLKVRYSRLYLLIANFFYGLGLVFAYWLFFQSLYVIQVLCPWCLIVTLSTTILFATIEHINLRQNNFGFGKDTNKKIQKFLDGGFDKLFYATWIVLMVVLVFLKFGDSLFA